MSYWLEMEVGKWIPKTIPISYPEHSRKLTWKPKKGPTKTTVLLKGGYVSFHVSLGECSLGFRCTMRAPAAVMGVSTKAAPSNWEEGDSSKGG